MIIKTVIFSLYSNTKKALKINKFNFMTYDAVNIPKRMPVYDLTIQFYRLTRVLHKF
jgi:hypothetical protein